MKTAVLLFFFLIIAVGIAFMSSPLKLLLAAGSTSSTSPNTNQAAVNGDSTTNMQVASGFNQALAQNTFNEVLSPTPTPSPSPSASPSASPSPSGVISIPQPYNVRIGDVGSLIAAVAAALLIVAALLTFLYLIMGGIQWITSGGDKAGMEAARGKIVNAVVGLVIVASAWAIMLLVQNFLGINIFGGTTEIPRAFMTSSPNPSPTPSVSPSPSG